MSEHGLNGDRLIALSKYHAQEEIREIPVTETQYRAIEEMGTMLLRLGARDASKLLAVSLVWRMRGGE